jgi:hypothetical protein
MESFWKDVTQSMINFYQRYHLRRPVHVWQAQQEQQYIRAYLSLYALDVLRHQCNYSMGILVSNLKRWKGLIIDDNNDETGGPPDVVFLLVDVYYALTKGCCVPLAQDEETQHLFDTVELYLLHSNYLTTLVDYALKHKKQSVLERLCVYCEHHCMFDIYTYIESLYHPHVKLQNGMCAKKILAAVAAAATAAAAAPTLNV